VAASFSQWAEQQVRHTVTKKVVGVALCCVFVRRFKRTIDAGCSFLQLPSFSDYGCQDFAVPNRAEGEGDGSKKSMRKWQRK
jgi:hypothetical protein